MAHNLAEIEQLVYTTTPVDALAEEIKRIYSETTSNSGERARAAVLLAMVWRRIEQVRSSEYTEEAFQIATERDDQYVLADVYYLKGLEAFRKSDLKLLNKFHQDALSAATTAGHTHRMAFSLYMLGNLAIRYGSYEDAIGFFVQAQRIAEEHGFLRLQTFILSKLAEVSLTSNEFPTARGYALKAIAVSEKLASAQDLLNSKIRLATIELELHNYDGATQLAEEVAPIVPENNKPLRCTIETLRGQILASRGSWLEAESQLKLAIGLALYSNSDRVRANIHILLAELYEKQDNIEAAIAEGLQSLEAANIANDAFQRKQALNALHRLYRTQGNIFEAYKYLEEYNALVSASDQALLKNRLEYHAVRNELEIERSKSEEGRRQSELLRIELKQREGELMEKTRHLIKQTEAVTQFRDELKAIIRKSPITDPLVHEIKGRLKSLPESELSWQDFDEQFKLVHPEFSTKLATQYPSLTPMERKICALLRLDLSSPEIAKLLFLSERNIQNHRYRLRKKLELGSDENMHTFLAKI
jgi:DNA-binding CsgD family transcriptional regulator/tetratricopeptide (TPR) repeat protein